VSRAARLRGARPGNVPRQYRRRPRGPRPGAVLAVAALSAGLAAVTLAGCAAPAPAGAPGPVSAARQAAAGTAPARAASAQVAASAAASAPACDPYASSLKPSGPPTVTPGSWMATIRKRGYLIAGVDQSTYHFGYLNPLDRQLEGFDIDQVRAVAGAIFGISPADPAVLGKIRFKAISDADRIPDVQGKKGPENTVDIVAHTMTITCDRLKQVDFSTVYFDAQRKTLVVQPPGGQPPPTLAQLGQRHESACATVGSDSVNSIDDAHAIAQKVAYWTDCLVKLQEGAVAGVVTDDSILEGLKAQDPNLTITGLGLPPVDEPYGLAISKAHPEFVRFVNAVLAREITSGQWAASYRLWVDSKGPPRPTWKIGYAG
jgi:polar amino acid transport system substrate-binding protein